MRNEGLFSLHALKSFDLGSQGEAGPTRSNAIDKAGPASKRRGRQLLDRLGYSLQDADNLTLLLKSDDRRRALAVLLQPDENPDSIQERFGSLSPVSYALTKANNEDLPWVILIRNGRLRLYPTDVQTGVGRRGRTETFVELDLRVIRPDQLAYLWLIFSAEALTDDGTVSQILEQSTRFAGELAKQLRERIYTEVVPRLARSVAKARNLENPSPQDLDLTYRMALTILFRLLFIAYAEDGDLLPYRTNEAYRRRSIQQKAHEIHDAHLRGIDLNDQDNHWQEVLRLFQAVDKSNSEWGIPAYNGGLFSDDPNVSPAGAAITALSLPDTEFVPALSHLLLSYDKGPIGPVDFRSLGVREFGTIYEGLLESELSVADVDLTTKYSASGRRKSNPTEKDLTYVPATGDQPVEVAKGEVYLHNKSGARKSSGSYYTKPFAVEHLLDRALEPALDAHITRLDKMDDTDAAAALFDFRVADIAMGSAHFLVAAIDRIEQRFADYLSKRAGEGRSLSGVLRELDGLRKAAHTSMGVEAGAIEIEDTQLLRRLIARRCIYGTDLNPMAVDLARLAVWIHTFVPGLPLAVLDHNLRVGNALVGVGTVEQIEDRLNEEKADLFGADATRLLEAAHAPLQRLRKIADATLEDVEASRAAMEEARKALADIQDLCDVLTAEPLSDDVSFDAKQWDGQGDDLERRATITTARKALKGLSPLHFPVAFPEIFLRDRPGFDVMLGNPPWKEATVEALAFWARHFPGLRGLSSTAQNKRMNELPDERPDLVPLYEAEVAEAAMFREALVSGGFPGMGTGDPDVYKAFSWRFWNLTAQQDGFFGVVLPRSALAAKGSTEFRVKVFNEAASVDLTLLLNNKKWVFSEVHPQYTIGLVVVGRGEGVETNVDLIGPYNSRSAFEFARGAVPHTFTGEEVLSWNDAAALPLLPTPESVPIFQQMRKSPRLDTNRPGEWRARPDTDLHATSDKPLMDLTAETCPEGYWPVLKGESFDLWDPECGAVYGYADPGPVLKRLQSKRLRSRKGSAHNEFPRSHLTNPATLAVHKPRIVFRDIVNRLNNRTFIVGLAPPNAFLTNKAPYFLWAAGDERDEAYLLGVLASLEIDWYARKVLERSANFFLVNLFPIPRPPRINPLWQQVVAISGRLAAVDERYADWAAAVGVQWGPLPALDKQDMIHELDAVVAHLYGLSRDQLIHIFETFHEGWDYQPRLDAVLKHFDDWARRAAEAAAAEEASA